MRGEKGESDLVFQLQYLKNVKVETELWKYYIFIHMLMLC